MPAPLGSLKDQTIDVLVLGGGLLGTSTARALAARGARVALVEPIDFGWGASGRTSRLALE
ncbi:FAD-dependent oxidoreductase, partial [bacterium]|nr:FAD-dependent oxidoreductase [bacterium]